MSKAVIYILRGTGRLAPIAQEVRARIKRTLKTVARFVPIGRVDIVVRDDPESTVPELGIGGYTPNAHTIYLSLDPQTKHVARILNRELASTVTHELHHVLRWRRVGYGTTLLEALVSEGLADHFDLEVNHERPKPWDVALSTHMFARVLPLARREFSSANYDHHAWFFGSLKRKIPRWAGYSLGFRLVGDFLRLHRARRASRLYGESARVILGSLRPKH